MRTVLKSAAILLGVLALTAVLAVPSEAGQRKYEGVTLRVMLPDGFTESKPVYDACSRPGRAGNDVKVSWYSMDELHDKTLIDFAAGNKAWDMLLVHSPSRGKWADMGIIEPLGKYIANIPVWWTSEACLGRLLRHFDPHYTHKGVWLGPALYVTGVALFYRTDLFNHPDEKKNFKTKYGYDLKEPETYKEFRDIAEFFTRKKGQTLAGNVLTADFYGTSHSDKPVGNLCTTL